MMASSEQRNILYDFRLYAALAIITTVSLGTIYSLVYDTAIDTSSPIAAYHPHGHPLGESSYFARKTNILNVYFIKRAWGWTSGAFFILWMAGPSERRTPARAARWGAATAVWLLFARWFFGMPLGARVTLLTGGECQIRLPQGEYVTVPTKHCVDGAGPLSPASHPDIFKQALSSLTGDPALLPTNSWRARAHLLKGHDISGHVFLMTLSVLFLASELQQFRRVSESVRSSQPYKVALYATTALIGIWFLALWTTSVYFHTVAEKVSGLRESCSLFCRS